MTPTGAIASAQTGADISGKAITPIAGNYRLMGVFGARALVGTPDGPLTVAAGDDVPGLGKVVTIRIVDGVWVLTTESARVVTDPER